MKISLEVSLIALFVEQVVSRQRLVCYDKSGANVTFGVQNVADLSASPYDFDNKIVNCTFNGIYLLYENINFNLDAKVCF